jgi:glycosyltransferase involved in cell wall biosynthesis
MKGINQKDGFVVPNSVGFSEDVLSQEKIRPYDVEKSVLKILCPFENHPHKGFHIIPKLLIYLENKGLNVHFILTMEKKDGVNDRKDEIFNNENNGISYIGKQKYFDMPELYTNSDIVFMPSVLEVFSSVCTESLYLKKPLVTSDKQFNSDIVGSFCSYCDPFSVESCASAIIAASQKVNDEVYLSEGNRFITAKFGKYTNRYQAIMKVINRIVT